MCERGAGRQEGPLKNAGCTDKEIDLFCQPCLPLNCHNEQHTILVHDPLIGPVERHSRVHLPPSYFLTDRLPHAGADRLAHAVADLVRERLLQPRARARAAARAAGELDVAARGHEELGHAPDRKAAWV